MKINRKWIIILAVIIFAVTIGKDLLIKSISTQAISKITGAPVTIGGFSLGLFKEGVKIENFKMYNPEGFSRELMVDIPKIYVYYSLPSILQGKLHLKNVELELKEIILVKNKEGRLNVDSLKVFKEKSTQEKAKKPAKAMPLQIDLLKLDLGRLVYKDYTLGEEPSVRAYDIGINKTYKNITSAQQLVLLILSEPMRAAGIKGAAIYGVSVLAGAGILPVAVAATLVGRDSTQRSFHVTMEKLYEVTRGVLSTSGTITKEDQAAGIMGASVDGAMIALKLRQISDKETEITVSARKLLLPKPEIAEGIIYKISQELE